MNIRFSKFNLMLEEIRSELNLPSPKVDDEISKYLIDIHKELPPPEKAWEFYLPSSSEYTMVGSKGNFSMVKGKAKSKKSFFLNMTLSVALSDDKIHETMRSPLKIGSDNVLYFDTEQSEYHVQYAVKRIRSQVGENSLNKLQTYHLRELNPKKRFEIIERVIESTPNIGLVVIDGIRDLITSINDESESTMMASKLLEWTQRFNIHIITVLHENPTGEKARGHLGTELTNKAEAVITVEVDKDNSDVSIVKPTSCRNKPFEPFAFTINQDGLPEVIDDYEINQAKSKKKMNFSSVDDLEKKKLIKEVFNGQFELEYNNLIKGIKYSLKVNYTDYTGVGNNRVKDLIMEAKQLGWIKQEKPRSPYRLGSV